MCVHRIRMSVCLAGAARIFLSAFIVACYFSPHSHAHTLLHLLAPLQDHQFLSSHSSAKSPCPLPFSLINLFCLLVCASESPPSALLTMQLWYAHSLYGQRTPPSNRKNRGKENDWGSFFFFFPPFPGGQKRSLFFWGALSLLV